jgi:hypothetical protein
MQWVSAITPAFAAAYRQVREHLLAAAEDAGQVRVDDRVPVLVRDLVEVAGDVDAGVVHEHVHVPQVRGDLLHARLHVGTVGDVELHGERGADLLGDPRGVVRPVLVRDHDARALVGVRARDRLADAAARARHDADPARQAARALPVVVAHTHRPPLTEIVCAVT